MSDIVERLRVHGDQFPIKNSAEWVDFASLYLVEAADEIERLRAALRPFAARTNSEEYIKRAPDHGLCAAISYTAGDYRRARAALEDRT